MKYSHGTVVESTPSLPNIFSEKAAGKDEVVTATVRIIDEHYVTADEFANTRTVPAAANSSGNGVRVLTLGEYKQAALALAEAFEQDHSCLYFLNTPDREHWTAQQKWDLHLLMMEYITYAHLLKGLVVSSGPNYDCVGLWMPPGENMDDFWTIVRSGMWKLSWQLSKEGRKRFFNEFLPLLNDTKAQVMGKRDNDSWYLVYIGTRPSGRGRGHARRVIEYVTSMADREKRACYLESSSEVNLKIYGKMGFELKKNIYLQREVEHVQLDIMVREPVKKDHESDADSGVYVK